MKLVLLLSLILAEAGNKGFNGCKVEKRFDSAPRFFEAEDLDDEKLKFPQRKRAKSLDETILRVDEDENKQIADYNNNIFDFGIGNKFVETECEYGKESVKPIEEQTIAENDGTQRNEIEKYKVKIAKKALKESIYGHQRKICPRCLDHELLQGTATRLVATSCGLCGRVPDTYSKIYVCYKGKTRTICSNCMETQMQMKNAGHVKDLIDEGYDVDDFKLKLNLNVDDVEEIITVEIDIVNHINVENHRLVRNDIHRLNLIEEGKPMFEQIMMTYLNLFSYGEQKYWQEMGYVLSFIVRTFPEESIEMKYAIFDKVASIMKPIWNDRENDTLWKTMYVKFLKKLPKYFQMLIEEHAEVEIQLNSCVSTLLTNVNHLSLETKFMIWKEVIEKQNPETVLDVLISIFSKHHGYLKRLAQQPEESRLVDLWKFLHEGAFQSIDGEFIKKQFQSYISILKLFKI